MKTDLFDWLVQTPGASAHPELAQRLKAAGLEDLHDRLARGECVRAPLEELYAQSALALRPEDYVPAQLEQKILELADRVDPYSVRTDRYQRLALGNPAELPRLEAEMRQLWAGYAATPVAEGQVTTESVVLHRMLKRAFDGWFLALTQARQGKWDEALGVAEGANALLYAVREAQEEIQSLTGALGLDIREEI